jgi:hypothetical protein
VPLLIRIGSKSELALGVSLGLSPRTRVPHAGDYTVQILLAAAPSLEGDDNNHHDR